MARLTLDWLHIIALLGAVQGVLLAVLLATRKSNRTASRLLAAAMLAFSIYLATDVYYAVGFEDVFPHFFGVAYPLPFLYGPLVYLYAVTAADRTRTLTRRDLWHFAPWAAVVVAGLPIYLKSGPEKIAFYHELQHGVRPLLIVIADPLKLISGIAYSLATIVFLQRHREVVKETYSSVERVNLRWLLFLGSTAAIIWMAAVLSEVLESTGILRVGRTDNVVTLAVAALVYAIGYMGLRQPEIFRYQTAEYPVQSLPVVNLPEPELVADAEAQAPRYERSGLSDRQAERLRERLILLMETEKPWQNSDLTLSDLAAQLATTPHKLSEVINSRLDLSFFDFVNGYRVREVQRRIAAGEARRVTMLSLALDAGFASKSTFNVAFKKHTALTPSDFRQTVGG